MIGSAKIAAIWFASHAHWQVLRSEIGGATSRWLGSPIVRIAAVGPAHTSRPGYDAGVDVCLDEIGDCKKQATRRLVRSAVQKVQGSEVPTARADKSTGGLAYTSRPGYDAEAGTKRWACIMAVGPTYTSRPGYDAGAGAMS